MTTDKIASQWAILQLVHEEIGDKWFFVDDIMERMDLSGLRYPRLSVICALNHARHNGYLRKKRIKVPCEGESKHTPSKVIKVMYKPGGRFHSAIKKYGSFKPKDNPYVREVVSVIP